MTAADVDQPPLPRRLQVEVTAACNLRCRMCIVRYRPAFPRSASMTLRRFERLLDALPSVREVVLQGVGEPLLAPDLYDMIAATTARGIDVEFNSNATLLTRAAGERLIAAGLAALHLSLDGATKETYEGIRDGARWETVVTNIEGFTALLRDRKAVRPALSLVMMLMRRNLHELPALVERAAAWGIPSAFAQGLSTISPTLRARRTRAIAGYVNAETIAGVPRDEVEAVYSRARATATRLGVALRLPALVERREPIHVNGVPVGCDWPWQGGYVTYSGAVLPCCMVMGRDRVELGHLDTASYTEIWAGDAFRRFRRGLIDGSPHPVCRGCALYRGTFWPEGSGSCTCSASTPPFTIPPRRSSTTACPSPRRRRSALRGSSTASGPCRFCPTSYPTTPSPIACARPASGWARWTVSPIRLTPRWRSPAATRPACVCRWSRAPRRHRTAAIRGNRYSSPASSTRPVFLSMTFPTT